MNQFTEALKPLKNSSGMYMVINSHQYVSALYHMPTDTVWNMYRDVSLNEWACINNKYRASFIEELWNDGNLVIDSAE